MIRQYLKTAALALLSSVLVVVPVTGCASSQTTQQKINTAVQDIATYAPVVVNDISALASDIASFDSADATAIQSFVTKLQSDVTPIEQLCKSYLAAPSSSLLSQITAAITSASTDTSSALLALLNIKNANSQLIAKGVLTTIATALTIMSGYLATTGSSTTTAQLKANRHVYAVLKQNLDRAKFDAAFEDAQSQGLVSSNLTPDMVLAGI